MYLKFRFKFSDLKVCCKVVNSLSIQELKKNQKKKKQATHYYSENPFTIKFHHVHTFSIGRHFSSYYKIINIIIMILCSS